jgi:hypothetical protein
MIPDSGFLRDQGSGIPIIDVVIGGKRGDDGIAVCSFKLQ